MQLYIWKWSEIKMMFFLVIYEKKRFLSAKLEQLPNCGTSSLRRAFSSLKWCSSNDISPIAVGPPQLGHEALPRASLNLMLSARSFSFSVLSCVFSWRSCWVCNKKQHTRKGFKAFFTFQQTKTKKEAKTTCIYVPSSECACSGTKT